MPKYTKELLPYLFCDDNDPSDTFAGRQAKRQQIAREIFDITKPDNPADCTVTLTISGNALLSILNCAQGLVRVPAKADADNGIHSSYLEVYAAIDQARDQLAEGRAKARQ